MRPKVEAREAADVGLAKDPTSLDLFRFADADQVAHVRFQRDTAAAFRDDFVTLQQRHDALSDAVETKVGRLDGTKKFYEKTLKDVRSSITVGFMYLYMIPQVEEQGAKPEEALDFLATTVETNSAIPPSYRLLVQKQRNSGGVVELFKSIVARAKSQDAFTNAVRKILRSEPPSWFHGNKDEWLRFLAWRSVFTKFFIFDTPYLGTTSQDALPDWFVNRDRQSPTRELATQECTQDEVEETILENAIKYARGEIAVLNGATAAKSAHVAVDTELERRALIENPNSFPELLIALDTLRAISWVYTAQTEQLSTMNTAQLMKTRIASSRERTRLIEGFTSQKETGLGSLPIALFLEQKFVEAEVIKSVEDRLNQHHIGTFHLLLDALDGSEETEEAFHTLEEFFPTTYAVLKPDIEPLLGLLTDEDRLLLTQSLDGYQAEKMEVLIWDIAALVAENCQKRDPVSEPEAVRKVIRNIQEHTAAWISGNWETLYMQLEQALAAYPDEVSAAPVSPLQTNIQNLQEAIDILTQGNLKGWKVYVGEEETVDKKKLHLLRGKTIAQREEALGAYFQGGNIVLDARSVIDLLDWLVTLPKDVFDAAKQKTGKERFIRLKLGEARVLYEANPLKIELILVIEPRPA